MVGHEVEMDETYVTHCRKGRIIDGIRERSAEHRPQNEDCRMKRSVSSRRSRDWENAWPGRSMWQSHLPWMRKLSVNV